MFLWDKLIDTVCYNYLKANFLNNFFLIYSHLQRWESSCFMRGLSAALKQWLCKMMFIDRKKVSFTTLTSRSEMLNNWENNWRNWKEKYGKYIQFHKFWLENSSFLQQDMELCPVLNKLIEFLRTKIYIVWSVKMYGLLVLIFQTLWTNGCFASGVTNLQMVKTTDHCSFNYVFAKFFPTTTIYIYIIFIWTHL